MIDPRVPKIAFMSEMVMPPARMFSARPTTTSLARKVTTIRANTRAIASAAATPASTPTQAEPAAMDPSTAKKAAASICPSSPMLKMPAFVVNEPPSATSRIGVVVRSVATSSGRVNSRLRTSIAAPRRRPRRGGRAAPAPTR
jgi:hypothetical protein